MPDANAQAVLTELMDWYQRGLKLAYGQCKFGEKSDLRLWSEQDPTRMSRSSSFDPAHDPMSCYEILMYTAMIAGKASPSDIQSAFDTASSQGGKLPFKYDKALQTELMKGKGKTYNINSHNPLPEPGDLVFINRMTHVAMATGRRVKGSELPNRKGINVAYAVGNAKIGGDMDCDEAQVLSFWPRYVPGPTEDRTGFCNTLEQSAAACALELTSIEDLVLGMAISVKGADTIDYSGYTVIFSRPAWAAAGYV